MPLNVQTNQDLVLALHDHIAMLQQCQLENQSLKNCITEFNQGQPND